MRPPPKKPWAQGCHNGRPTVKITVRTSARVRVYPADALMHPGEPQRVHADIAQKMSWAV
jgi:hypothetical protein